MPEVLRVAQRLACAADAEEGLLGAQATVAARKRQGYARRDYGLAMLDLVERHE